MSRLPVCPAYHLSLGAKWRRGSQQCPVTKYYRVTPMVNLVRLTVKSKTILKRGGVAIPTSEFLWVRNTPVVYEQCKWIYERPYIQTVATDTKIWGTQLGLESLVQHWRQALVSQLLTVRVQLWWSIISSYLFLHIYSSFFLSIFLSFNLLFFFPIFLIPLILWSVA